MDAVLKDKFGLTRFKDIQLEIITSILEHKRDVCAILATGYGKSLCYQFPPVYSGKPAIVVSPLISLMQDQMELMKKIGISACCYNSSLTSRNLTRMNILCNKFQLIYITPEMAIKSESMIKQLHDTCGLSLIAIDESHCISQYGHDFRPDYLKLSCFKKWLGNSVPIVALTATATAYIKQNICAMLKLHNPLMITTSCDRSNLEIYVQKKKELDSLEKLINPREAIIIYCQTRKGTEFLSHYLRERGVRCREYHAGLKKEVRTEVHHLFINDEITCIVATISFGMGINKPDIRKVIHYGAPKDIESYYQEIGRAGRDGKKSYCYLFYSDDDLDVMEGQISKIYNSKLQHIAMDKYQYLRKYLESKRCRRIVVFEYFGETTKSDYECLNCDNCLDTPPILRSLSDNLQKIYHWYQVEGKKISKVCRKTRLSRECVEHGLLILFQKGVPLDLKRLGLSVGEFWSLVDDSMKKRKNDSFQSKIAMMIFNQWIYLVTSE